MSSVGYPSLATGRVWLISYKLRLSHMGSDVGQIIPTASQHRDHSILYALVCEKELSQMGKNSGNTDIVCKKINVLIKMVRNRLQARI